ncbi:hypothetical protein DRE_04592 [Drechslerella stenobrocha 248]|uniref:Uncharacterized protein n=1 Tax=Drechslerella stenobrocha 248 TaxID=1043628 RepID=W7HSJ5_9PEZI|nr:hypothetical protein DRE_04592 [Drechslerella stenobrocha 248]
MFAKYLDVQKSTDVMELDLRDLRDRFKRFVGRWNLGELAAGWYDKGYKAQIDSDAALPRWDDYLKYRDERKSSAISNPPRDSDRERSKDRKRRDRSRDRHSDRDRHRHRDRDHDRHDRRKRSERDHDSESLEQTESRVRNMTDEELNRAIRKLDGSNTPSGAGSGPEDLEMKDGDDSDDSDFIGPPLPDSIATPAVAGAKPPTRQDLDLQRELDDEETELRRADLRYERKKERKLEKERLEELVPRAEPGSRERQLEKKREAAATNRAFADAKSGDVEEVGESTLMGGEESFLQQKKAMERKKNERELRREALLRARKVERDERLQVHKQKEEQTMKMLRALAEKFR